MEREKEDEMILDENAKVSADIRRIINNGFYTHHPFRSSSGQLGDFIRIAEQIRSLPADDFSYCFEAIAEQVDKRRLDCTGCYGKGLAFLKYLAKDIDEQRYAKSAAQYHEFFTARECIPNYEEILLELIQSMD
jgi:hypothetical protein